MGDPERLGRVGRRGVNLPLQGVQSFTCELGTHAVDVVAPRPTTRLTGRAESLMPPPAPHRDFVHISRNLYVN